MRIEFGDQFKKMANCSDSTIILTNLAPIKLTDSSDTIWDVLDAGSSRWISYCESLATEELKFELIWDKNRKILQLVFSYPNFNSSSQYQCIYVRFRCGGISNGGFVIANENRNQFLNLCSGYNQFKVDLSRFKLNNISSIPPENYIERDNKIREGIGGNYGVNILNLVLSSNSVIVSRNSYYRNLFNNTSQENKFLDSVGGLNTIHKEKVYTEMKITCCGYKGADQDVEIPPLPNSQVSPNRLPIYGVLTYDEYEVINDRPVKLIAKDKTISIEKVPDVKRVMGRPSDSVIIVDSDSLDITSARMFEYFGTKAQVTEIRYLDLWYSILAKKVYKFGNGMFKWENEKIEITSNVLHFIQRPDNS